MQINRIFITKAIFILSLYFSVTSCVKYYVGDIKIVKPHNIKGLKRFNYIMYNDRIAMKGKIGQELFVGDIHPLSLVKKIEKKRNPHIKEKFIDNKRHFAFAKMVGNKNSIIECFIKQISDFKFQAGGNGRCYILKTKQVFDIILEKKGGLLKRYEFDYKE